MVQLQILSGKKAGGQFTASRLPMQIGRAAGSDLCLEEPGVWPRHFQITRQGRDLVCRAEPNALLSVNGVQVDQAVLRNGDVISIGALKIQFALSPVRQSSPRAREWLTWAGLALLCLGQAVLIYRLMR
ncbi:MAG: FHA domain-containing protein [Verrucomicrobiota bacterium]|jgi:pSer/pThr/pTyr-binding forkhead associated (FHA) protein